jgi:hypothetical protein
MALLDPRQTRPRRNPANHEFWRMAVTPWNAVLRELMRLPDADALKAHVDGLGDHRAYLAVHGAEDNTKGGEDQQDDPEKPDPRAHVATTQREGLPAHPG